MILRDGRPFDRDEKALLARAQSHLANGLARGTSNDEIGTLLGLRSDSVSRHLRAVYAKMGVDHRVAATIHALDLGRRLHAQAKLLRGGATSLVVATR